MLKYAYVCLYVSVCICMLVCLCMLMYSYVCLCMLMYACMLMSCNIFDEVKPVAVNKQYLSKSIHSTVEDIRCNIRNMHGIDRIHASYITIHMLVFTCKSSS